MEPQSRTQDNLWLNGISLNVWSSYENTNTTTMVYTSQVFDPTSGSPY